MTTPIPFRVVLRGYDPVQVDQAHADLERAVQTAREEAARLGSEAARLRAEAEAGEHVAQRGDVALDDQDVAGVDVARAARRGQVDLAADEAKPGRVLALLAHPLVRLGLDRAALVRAACALEIGVLRDDPGSQVAAEIDAH